MGPSESNLHQGMFGSVCPLACLCGGLGGKVISGLWIGTWNEDLIIFIDIKKYFIGHYNFLEPYSSLKYMEYKHYCWSERHLSQLGGFHNMPCKTSSPWICTTFLCCFAGAAFLFDQRGNWPSGGWLKLRSLIHVNPYESILYNPYESILIHFNPIEGWTEVCFACESANTLGTMDSTQTSSHLWGTSDLCTVSDDAGAHENDAMLAARLEKKTCWDAKLFVGLGCEGKQSHFPLATWYIMQTPGAWLSYGKGLAISLVIVVITWFSS